MANELNIQLNPFYNEEIGLTLLAKVYNLAGTQQGTDTVTTEPRPAFYTANYDLSTLANGKYSVVFETATAFYGWGVLFVDGGAEVTVLSQVTVGTNNDKTGYSISGTKTTLDALADYDPDVSTVEGAITYTQASRIMLAEASGKLARVGNTVTFRDQADTKDRMTATIDDNGQRTAITTDVT